MSLSHKHNKKQCSRQLQCEVPCAGNVVNSSLSSLSSTSHAVFRGVQPWGSSQGGSGRGGGLGRGRGLRGRGQGTFHPPCHILHYHMVLHPKGTSHNDIMHLVLGHMHTSMLHP